MPMQTVENTESRVARARKKLEALGDAAAAADRRAARKRVKRAQRKLRRLKTAAERKGAGKKDAGEGA